MHEYAFKPFGFTKCSAEGLFVTLAQNCQGHFPSENQSRSPQSSKSGDENAVAPLRYHQLSVNRLEHTRAIPFYLVDPFFSSRNVIRGCHLDRSVVEKRRAFKTTDDEHVHARPGMAVKSITHLIFFEKISVVKGTYLRRENMFVHRSKLMENYEPMLFIYRPTLENRI